MNYHQPDTLESVKQPRSYNAIFGGQEWDNSLLGTSKDAQFAKEANQTRTQREYLSCLSLRKRTPCRFLP